MGSRGAYLRKNAELGFVQVFFIAAAFTSSFDIFLVFNLGFNFRITQIFLLIPIGLAMLKATQGRVIWPLGFGWLLLWSMFIIAFVPNTPFLLRSMGYAAWLVFDALAIFACVQFFSTPVKIVGLLRWYVYSFVFVAIFGLIQFISPLVGLGDTLLITQWWVSGVVPRINGFSYEASFFATYLLMGWVLCAYLLEAKINLFTRTHLRLYFLTITLALILSSSRMGILMMLIWYIQYPLRFIVRLGQGYVNKRLSRTSLILAGLAGLAVLLVGSVVYFFNFDEISFLLSGLGIFGGSSHSADTRSESMVDTFLIFMNSPFVGYSLGGVGPAIAKMHGVTSIDFDVVKEYEGNSIFVEVLAASGIFGFIPFCMFIFYIVRKPILVARKVPSAQSAILIALTLALIFEFAILQFNQIILRPYLWMHISVLAACYSTFKRQANVDAIKATSNRAVRITG